MCLSVCLFVCLLVLSSSLTFNMNNVSRPCLVFSFSLSLSFDFFGSPRPIFRTDGKTSTDRPEKMPKFSPPLSAFRKKCLSFPLSCYVVVVVHSAAFFPRHKSAVIFFPLSATFFFSAVEKKPPSLFFFLFLFVCEVRSSVNRPHRHASSPDTS